MTDLQLLAEFARTRSSEAFVEIVRRHVDLVYGTARRLVEDEHLAQDVAQAAFIVLAKKAKGVDGRRLAGWLVNTTRLAAKDARRAKLCREKHEGRAAQMRSSMAPAADEPTLEELTPLLDEALARLNETDRTAVVTRFLQGKSFAEVGAAMGSSEEAARKRVERAVEKLRTVLMKRGVAPSVGGLMVILAASQAQAAPAGLAGVISAGAVSGGAGISAVLAKGVMKMMAWAKVKVIVIAGLALLIFGAILAAARAADHGPSTQAAPAQPTTPDDRSLSSGTTPLLPGERVPDAAALVREVRQAEKWIDTVRTFRVQGNGKWTHSAEWTETRRAELQKLFPQTPANDQIFRELLPETNHHLDLAFDDHRLSKHEDSPDGVQLIDVRIWDGKQAIIHEQYPQEEHFALDKEPTRFISPYFLSTLGWPRSGAHAFWWLPETERQEGWEYFGNPDEFSIAGRGRCGEVECYVLIRDWNETYWRWYVGIADHRLYAIEERRWPPLSPDGTRIILQLARDHGQSFDTMQQFARWVEGLPADQRSGFKKECSRSLWPLSVPNVIFWFADYREVNPGCWMPMTLGQRNYEAGSTTATADCIWQITSAQANEALPDGLFRMQFKEGIRVIDWGYKPPLEYVYKAKAAATEPK